jgi:hypothetical protein
MKCSAGPLGSTIQRIGSPARGPQGRRGPGWSGASRNGSDVGEVRMSLPIDSKLHCGRDAAEVFASLRDLGRARDHTATHLMTKATLPSSGAARIDHARIAMAPAARPWASGPGRGRRDGNPARTADDPRFQASGMSYQNIVFGLAEVPGTICSTSKCSTILPFSSRRKMSTPAQVWSG